jgi:hypothetical protein
LHRNASLPVGDTRKIGVAKECIVRLADRNIPRFYNNDRHGWAFLSVKSAGPFNTRQRARLLAALIDDERPDADHFGELGNGPITAGPIFPHLPSRQPARLPTGNDRAGAATSADISQIYAGKEIRHLFNHQHPCPIIVG